MLHNHFKFFLLCINLLLLCVIASLPFPHPVLRFNVFPTLTLFSWPTVLFLDLSLKKLPPHIRSFIRFIFWNILFRMARLCGFVNWNYWSDKVKQVLSLFLLLKSSLWVISLPDIEPIRSPCLYLTFFNLFFRGKNVQILKISLKFNFYLYSL